MYKERARAHLPDLCVDGFSLPLKEKKKKRILALFSSFLSTFILRVFFFHTSLIHMCFLRSWLSFPQKIWSILGTEMRNYPDNLTDLSSPNCPQPKAKSESNKLLFLVEAIIEFPL